MENNPEIALAWQFIENTGTHLFLTGKAGTGKTTFLRKLRAESPKRMIVLAPTGIAAINAGGVTIFIADVIWRVLLTELILFFTSFSEDMIIKD
jgi:ABC-type ATPase involved in cell division